MNCSACGYPTNLGARFCSHCGRPMIGAPLYPLRTRLVRPLYGRAIAGVCAGFAQEYGWDVVLIRILLCVVVFFGCGLPILAYLVAWIVMPNEPFFFRMQHTDPQPAPPAATVEGAAGSQPAA